MSILVLSFSIWVFDDPFDIFASILLTIFLANVFAKVCLQPAVVV